MDPAGTCASSRRRFLGWRDGSEAPAPIVVWETYHAPSYAAAVVSEPCRRCIGAIAIWHRGLRRGTPFRHLTGVRRRSERVSPMDESRPRRRASKNPGRFCSAWLTACQFHRTRDRLRFSASPTSSPRFDPLCAHHPQLAHLNLSRETDRRSSRGRLSGGRVIFEQGGPSPHSLTERRFSLTKLTCARSTPDTCAP
jgi:hypothetical protein